MSKYTQGACPKCNSSDAYTTYEDGSYCFSCQYSTGKGKEYGTNTNINTDELSSIRSMSSGAISTRGICKDVVDHYGVKLDIKTNSHYYPYTKDGNIVAYKQRQLPKSFFIKGDFNNVELFGQNVATSGKILTITEGEIDAMSVSQAMYIAYKRMFPVVSIPSATGTKAVLEQRDWIRSFESVVLFFDNDDAGKKAIDTVAKIIGAGKVKVAKLKAKDPNEALLKHESIIEAFWNAQTYTPGGIVVGESIWEAYQNRKNTESIPYPECLSGLNSKLKGMREGEIVLFTSGTGSGKSTVMKEITIDLVKRHEKKVGLISLEESIGDTAEKFIQMSDKDNERKAYEDLFSDEKIVLLDHQGSVSDDSLTDKIEYMALMGCTHLILDHITIAVSEGTDGLTGNEAIDRLMSDLLKIVKKHNIWLGLISHLRKSQSGGKSFEEGNMASIDDIKGSGSIKQISFDIISFSRNLVSDSESERNTINFRVLKSRFTGLTGNAGSAEYNSNTYRLMNVEKDFTTIEV